MKDTLNTHECRVDVIGTSVSYGKDDDPKYDDYIDVFFKAFGKEYKTFLFELVKINFMYINTPEMKFS